jgi:hypothetical protein
MTRSGALAGSKYCAAAICCRVEKCYPREKAERGVVAMKLPRRTFLHLAIGAGALPFLPHIARAQAYPTRPVRLIVGFPLVAWPMCLRA